MVSDAAPDQQAACPGAAQLWMELTRCKIGEFQIGPVIEAGALRALTGGQALPGGRRKGGGNCLGGAGDHRLAAPGIELAIGVNPEHIALAHLAQLHLDLADPVDAVRSHPGKWHPGRQRALDHADRQLWLGGPCCMDTATMQHFQWLKRFCRFRIF